MFARWRAATVLATVLAVAPAHADAVANFYKHRQVDLIVGSGPGGGYDIYARLLARRQFPLQPRPEGRHRDRHVYAQHAAHRSSRWQCKRPIRSAQADLA